MISTSRKKILGKIQYKFITKDFVCVFLSTLFSKQNEESQTGFKEHRNLKYFVLLKITGKGGNYLINSADGHDSPSGKEN